MPVVPFSSIPQSQGQLKPDEQYILMAGAQMASEKQKPTPNAPAQR